MTAWRPSERFQTASMLPPLAKPVVRGGLPRPWLYSRRNYRGKT
ncbi:MAG: hypothetical protein Q4G28_10405 [Neisseria sp.]|nr:hypothetical protein [Neisseria sp.]